MNGEPPFQTPTEQFEEWAEEAGHESGIVVKTTLVKIPFEKISGWLKRLFRKEEEL